MARREGRDEVLFGSADGPLCREGAVILRGGVLKGKGDGVKKGGELGRGFVVDFEEGERVGERLEERNDRREGGDIGGG